MYSYMDICICHYLGSGMFIGFTNTQKHRRVFRIFQSVEYVDVVSKVDYKIENVTQNCMVMSSVLRIVFLHFKIIKLQICYFLSFLNCTNFIYS